MNKEINNSFQNRFLLDDFRVALVDTLGIPTTSKLRGELTVDLNGMSQLNSSLTFNLHNGYEE